MAEKINQSTAFRVPFKAFLSADGKTEAPGKTIAITISKNGGAFANPAAGATNATEISDGWYYVDLDTDDTDTLGPLAVRGAEGDIDDVGVVFTVTAAPSVWDELTEDHATAGTFGALLDSLAHNFDNLEELTQELSDNLVNSNCVETGVNVPIALRYILATATAPVAGFTPSGAMTLTFSAGGTGNSGTPRLTVEADGIGNRITCTYL